jgi:hypothetical protein
VNLLLTAFPSKLRGLVGNIVYQEIFQCLMLNVRSAGKPFMSNLCYLTDLRVQFIPGETNRFANRCITTKNGMPKLPLMLSIAQYGST